MIGTLIGDLAAWTYENDQDTFWKQLIPNKGHGAKPSVYGHALMQAASNNLKNLYWGKPSIIGTPSDGCRYYGQWLMWLIVGAWIDKLELNYMPEFESLDKEERYASMFVTELIKLLRHGATKSEAYHSVKSFEDISKTWEWRTPGDHLGLLTYIFRAWNAFYLAYDYTSTIHNAAQWPDDRHLTCALAGTFADAMYGCNFNMIKKKYAKDGETSHFFGVLSIGRDYGYNLDLTMEMAECSRENRSFIAKNNVLTNVEKNYWKKCHIYIDRIFLNNDRKKIYKSDICSFDNRYGIYLDDGWLYCFRSGIQILRFKLEKEYSDNIYKIQNVMITDVMNFSESMKALFFTLEKTCKVSGYTPNEYYNSKNSELRHAMHTKECPDFINPQEKEDLLK